MLLHCWWECKLVQPLWKTVWKGFPYSIELKKTKIELSHNPAIPLLSIVPGKMKILIQKHTCAPVFIAALFTLGKTWKQPKCPSTDECIKIWLLYAKEYNFFIKKREIMPLVATQIDLEMIILSKANHTEKDKLSCDITYIWNLRKEIQMNFTKWK